MKKTLALVLALIMVLALVPTAFAAINSTVESDSYKATVFLTEQTIASIESTEKTFKTSFEATGKAPTVAVTIPFDAIKKSANALWANGTPQLNVKLETLGGKEAVFEGTYKTDLKVYVNGTELKSSEYTLTSGALSFTTDGLSKTNATYSYEVKLVGKNDSGDTMTETVNLYIAYNNNTKPVYELKFNQPTTSGIVLKDGVYFIDSRTNAQSTVDSITVNVAKNDGSKFTEIAYYGRSVADATAYPVADKDNHVTDSTITIKSGLQATGADYKPHTYKVSVETEYAIYQGTITVKYRNNVANIDPRGISFAKSEYQIGVHEVLNPAYTTVVPVYNDIASAVELKIHNGEQNVIDVQGNKITGMKEGTVYVTATYKFDNNDSDPLNDITYTATAKITVKGTYQVTDKANYKVTTSSGNLNVRASASTSAKKIGSLKKGAVVEVVEIKDGWAKIVYPAANYTNGYVSAQYLTKQGTKPETVVGTKTVIARVLNVRSGAGTSYSIVGKLTRNTKVEVIETVASGKWAKIKFNDSYAYVSCTYLQ